MLCFIPDMTDTTCPAIKRYDRYFKNIHRVLGEKGLWVTRAWVQISALPLSSHETLDKFCNYYVPLFPHLWTEKTKVPSTQG